VHSASPPADVAPAGGRVLLVAAILVLGVVVLAVLAGR